MGASGISLGIETIAFALIAGLLAVLAGAFIGEGAYQLIRRHNLASTILAPTTGDRMLLRLRSGVRPLLGLSRLLIEKVPGVHAVCRNAQILLDQKSVPISEEALLSDLIAAAFLAGLIGWAITSSLVFGIALCCLVLVGFGVYVRNASEKQTMMMREDVPEALRMLSISFRSGHSLLQTLSDSSRETKGYLSYLFKVASDRLEMGDSPTDALSIMRGNKRVPELSFVAVALDVQHQSGGSIAPVIESATDSVESELKLTRSLRVQTAQAKLSASIVTIMPFLLIALFSMMSPDFLSPFFSSILGMALLALALVMQLSGVLIVRRMLRVETE